MHHRRDGRVVEGTPLLREHTPKKCIEGSNPSLSANHRYRRLTMPAKKKPLPRSLKLHAMHSAGGRGTSTTGACGNPIAFTMQTQEQTQWCWAAVSVSVNLYYHATSGQTQCAV